MTKSKTTCPAPGESYWHQALHEFSALMPTDRVPVEGGPDDPVKFKAYRGWQRHSLPPPEETIGPVRTSSPACRSFGAGWLSTFLYYTNGMFRLELGPEARWPYHRSVPSARCFCPTELYCWIPESGRLPAGVYYYDAAHHALVLLRHGDLRETLGQATGTELQDAHCVLVLSALFWRTAFRYGDYAYRLCTQEAGMVAGNALLVAAALGSQGNVHYQFLDEAVARLLGLVWPEESPMSVVPLFPWRGEKRRPRRRTTVMTSEQLLAATVPIRVSGTGVGAIDQARCARMIETDSAGRCSETNGITVMAAPSHQATRTLPVSGTGPDLARVLRLRQSGGRTFNPSRHPVPMAVVRRILSTALDAHPSDIVPDCAAPPIQCYVWAVGVSDGASKVYRLAGGELEPVMAPSAGPLGRTRAANINYRAATFVVFLTADRQAATRAFGGRSFRILNQEAGVVAQRICVMSAAESLAARVHNGYRAATVARNLGLPDGCEPLFQIVVGGARATEVYQMPIPVAGSSSIGW